MKRSLYRVTKDLRINDNVALNLASASEHLPCVHVVEKQWFMPNNFKSKHLGDKRCLHPVFLCLIGYRLLLIKNLLVVSVFMVKNIMA